MSNPLYVVIGRGSSRGSYCLSATETTRLLKHMQEDLPNSEVKESLNRGRKVLEMMKSENAHTIFPEIIIEKNSIERVAPPEEGKRSFMFKKNNMRNKKCMCGSNKKFKKCCWNKYK